MLLHRLRAWSKFRRHRPGLARDYGFAEEELDFIINYDIKYRMGREAETE